MWPDRVWNPGPLTYESGAPSIALCGPATGYAESDRSIGVGGGGGGGGGGQACGLLILSNPVDGVSQPKQTPKDLFSRILVFWRENLYTTDLDFLEFFLRKKSCLITESTL